MKEVIFFTYGDSTDISTWSNVPYLFSRALESKGVKVNRINITVFPNRILGIVWSRILKPVINLLWPTNMYTYMRTPFAKAQVNKLIKYAVNKYPQSDYCIFLTYDYYNKFSNIPSVIYADVTFEMEKIGRRNQVPCFLEKTVIKRENTAISNSKLVVPLFKRPAEELILKGFNNIRCCDHYVINNIYEGAIDPTKLIDEKMQSNIILFIGNKTTYYIGAQLLIEAFMILKPRYPSLELHIVAMEHSDFPNLPKGVVCHGYLRKDVTEERELYYNLIKSARLICNPTPKWAGISSIMEAMYFYTPFIISPFDDFKKYIGEELDCGYYNEEFDANVLANNIMRLMENKEYKRYALNCHNHVKDYTWDNFTDWFISQL